VTRTAWIQLFLFLHVLGAICALGPTLTYGFWRWRAESAGREHLTFVLRTVSWVEGHLATPAYVAQAFTGFALILLEKIRFLHTAWLLSGVAIYAVIAVGAPVVYVPLVRRQMELAERTESTPGDVATLASYRDASARSRRFGLAIVFLTIVIVYLMVAKPVMWSAG
jgi:uncharacterized membrane protein